MSTISDLIVFNEVLTAGSFVGGAKQLEMTPSGVSRRIGRMEQRLGARLFHRTTRHISLTEAGEILAERSGAILAAIETAEMTVREFSTAPKGTLRIAASDALSSQVIAPFLPRFFADYPDLSVTLIPGDGRVDLLNERVDLALTFERPAETSFIVKKIIADPWIIVAAPNYLERYGTPTSPADLHMHTCLTIHARQHTRDDWTFVKNGDLQTVKVDSQFSSIGLNVKAATRAGVGIARLAHFLVRPDIQRGRLTPLLLDYMPPSDRHIYAVYPHRQHLPAKVRVFIDGFSQYARDVLPRPEAFTRV